jgi:adenine-specific DNA-methyltransferase
MKSLSSSKAEQGENPAPLVYHNPKLQAFIYQDDVLESLKKIKSNTVQLVVTSPPYNIGKEYETKTNYKEYFLWQEQVISECFRILKPGGSICWQVGNGIDKGEVIPLDAVFYSIFKKHELTLRNRIIWIFGHGLHAKNRFSGRHESILWFTKGAEYKFNLDAVRVPVKYPNKKHFKGPKIGQLSSNPLGKNPSDVWDITNVKAMHPEKTEHPCQFPVALVERLVLSLTDSGDLVVDPFVGAGTTLVAAALHGRKSLGIEIQEKYVEIAVSRLDNLHAGTLKTVSISQMKRKR